ncbi:hypothetical protein, partial [Bradyrhizobium yuanmingense]|uniref:hypothetical protein n=1 Tax=Bradyrhizobium yuanmingense TaxID=108015 RepID=UPI001AEC6443
LVYRAPTVDVPGTRPMSCGDFDDATLIWFCRLVPQVIGGFLLWQRDDAAAARAYLQAPAVGGSPDAAIHRLVIALFEVSSASASPLSPNVRYSVLTLRSSITLRQDGISAAIRACSSAGVLALASTP